MADILVPFGANADESPKVRLVDQGDGTYALRVAIAGGGGGGGGPSPQAPLNAFGTGTNAAAVATIPAPGAGNYIQLNQIIFSYDATPAPGATVTIAATGFTSIVFAVTSSGPGPINLSLVRIPNNTACTATLSAGGTGVVGRINALHSIQAA